MSETRSNYKTSTENDAEIKVKLVGNGAILKPVGDPWRVYDDPERFMAALREEVFRHWPGQGGRR